MNIEVYKTKSPTDPKKTILKKDLPRPPYRIILNGASGSGKTQVIFNFLLNPKLGYASYFDYINVFIGSLDDLDEYRELAHKHKCMCYDDDANKYSSKLMRIDEKMSIRQGVNNDELLNLIDEMEQNELLKKKRYLFVFDDLVATELLKNSVKASAIDVLFIRGRHIGKGVSTIISTQKWNMLKTNLRAVNSTHVFLFNGLPNHQKKLIAGEISGGYDEKEFIEIYEKYTNQKYSFILINLREPKEKYIQDKNFNYIN